MLQKYADVEPVEGEPLRAAWLDGLRLGAPVVAIEALIDALLEVGERALRTAGRS